MIKSILNLKIILELPILELSIDNLDMDFCVEKSTNNAPDKAYVNIWNLDEIFYKMLSEDVRQVNLYTKYDGQDRELLFSGYVNPQKILRRPVEYPWYNLNAPTNDVYTLLKLVESRRTYTSGYINKNYREMVSTNRIISDCVEAMGLGCVILNSEMPEKIYSSYKAIGKPHTILAKICKALNITFTVQNGIVYIGDSNFSGGQVDMPELNSTNSVNPLNIGQNKVHIITKFNPRLCPNQLIKCKFDSLEGIFTVLDVCSSGNNYSEVCKTEITIGI